MQSHTNYTYDKIFATSARIDWTVDNVLDASQRFDFQRPFLVRALAATRSQMSPAFW